MLDCKINCKPSAEWQTCLQIMPRGSVYCSFAKIKRGFAHVYRRSNPMVCWMQANWCVVTNTVFHKFAYYLGSIRRYIKKRKSVEPLSFIFVEAVEDAVTEINNDNTPHSALYATRDRPQKRGAKHNQCTSASISVISSVLRNFHISTKDYNENTFA